MAKTSFFSIARMIVLFSTAVCLLALAGILFGLWYKKDGATAPPMEQLKARTVVLTEAPRLRSGPVHSEYILRFVGDSLEYRVAGYAYLAADTLGISALRGGDTVFAHTRRLEMAKGTLFRDQLGTSEVWALTHGTKTLLDHGKADSTLRQGAQAETDVFLKGWLFGLGGGLLLLILALRDIRRLKFQVG
jgi:hypothetical protein